MKINLLTDYAIRTIKSIAEHERGIVTSNYIAEKEDISHGVLMKVLRILRVSNIVASHQGRGEIAGGYSLRTPISEITFLKIIEIMEGPIELSFRSRARNKNDGEIMPERSPEHRHTKEQNGIEMEYQRISEVIRREMNRYSIEELLRMRDSK